MTPILKNVYIDALDDIVNKYNTYQRTNKMKPADVKRSRHIDSKDDHDSKLKIGDIVKIPRYTNIFEKGYVPK